LDDLFDIAHSNAMNTIKIDEDKEFLLLQRQKRRVGCMLGRDVKLAEKEQRKTTRKDAEYKRKDIQQNSGYLKTGNQYLFEIITTYILDYILFINIDCFCFSKYFE